MKWWIFDKGERLYEEGCIELDFVDFKGNVYFNVEDKDRGKVFRVKVGEDLEEYCDCNHGVSGGVNWEKCPHKLGVFIFIREKIVDGGLNERFFERGSSDRCEEEVEGSSLGEELSESQKKVLKDLVSCEWCGSDVGKQVHRVHRQGSYTLRNIMVLCKDCHRLVHFKEEGHRKK